MTSLNKFSKSALIEQLTVLRQLLKVANNPEYVRKQIEDVKKELEKK